MVRRPPRELPTNTAGPIARAIMTLTMSASSTARL